jgi:hypothetical protein
VREALREVADLAAAGRVVLLGQQAQRVAQGEQALEQRLGVLHATRHRVVVGQPKAAGQEGALVAREAVEPVLGRVAQDEAVP